MAILSALTTIKRHPRFAWFWRVISPAVAAYMFTTSQLTVRTSVVTVEGPGRNESGAAVYVNWHKYVPFLCVHHAQHRRWLLMSSAPYLQGVALWCSWMEMKVVWGAPGERSWESLVHLVEALKRGESVVLAADGPAGPGFRVKPGCVDLARAAGVPIIPMSYRSRKGKSNLKRWDHFYTVGKFDEIEVWYGTPIIVDPSESDTVALERVQRGLDELD